MDRQALEQEAAELATAIEQALGEWRDMKSAEQTAEQAVLTLRAQAAELRARRQEVARALDAAVANSGAAWANFRQIEARLKAAQRRLGLTVQGASPQVLAAHGIPTAEAVSSL